MATKICGECDKSFDPKAEDQDLPEDAKYCADCQYERENREWERKQKLSRDKAQEWVGRAFGAFVGCQSFGVKPPEFDLGYAAYVIFTMAGRNDEIAAAAEKFVNEAIPLIEAAQKSQAAAANG